jgi:hypothetical protein
MCYFNVDEEPQDDIKVSFGFYWATILKYQNKRRTQVPRIHDSESGKSTEDLPTSMREWKSGQRFM